MIYGQNTAIQVEGFTCTMTEADRVALLAAVKEAIRVLDPYSSEAFKLKEFEVVLQPEED